MYHHLSLACYLCCWGLIISGICKYYLNYNNKYNYLKKVFNFKWLMTNLGKRH